MKSKKSNAEKYKWWNRWYELSGLDDEAFDKADAFCDMMWVCTKGSYNERDH